MGHLTLPFPCQYLTFVYEHEWKHNKHNCCSFLGIFILKITILHVLWINNCQLLLHISGFMAMEKKKKKKTRHSSRERSHLLIRFDFTLILLKPSSYYSELDKVQLISPVNNGCIDTQGLDGIFTGEWPTVVETILQGYHTISGSHPSLECVAIPEASPVSYWFSCCITCMTAIVIKVECGEYQYPFIRSTSNWTCGELRAK